MRFIKNIILIAIGVSLASCDRRAVTVEKLYVDQPRFVGLSYFLPRGIVTLKISKKKGVKTTANISPDPVITLEITDIDYVPDPTFHYSINMHHNVFFHDKIIIEVGPKQLLKSINTTTIDKTPEIIKTIANAPLEILDTQQEAFVKEDGVEFFDITFTLDPTRVEDRARLNQILYELAPDDQITFSARPYVSLPAGINIPKPDCNVDPCFRTAMPYALELHYPGRTTTTPLVVARAVVVLPNKHIVGQVPITRAAFVEKKLDLTFSDGMLTKADLDNPSEALAFIQIPIDVAKAIVAIPSALFNFKVEQVQADNELLKAQKSNLDLRREMIETQNQLLTAQAAAPNG